VYDGSTWEVYAQVGGQGGNAVTLNGIQTLTNKTLTSPTITSSALITASSGLLEYDGKVPYFTPQGLQRGVVPGMQYYRLNTNRALVSSTSAQSIFGVGVTLSSNTTYAFQAIIAAQKTTTTTSHAYTLGFGGTATVDSIGYGLIRTFDTGGFYPAGGATTVGGFVDTVVSPAIIGASASATNYQSLQLNGTVNITTGGTFIPQITISATGPIYTIQTNSYFLIYPIGQAGSNTSVGTWA
jgi:hypothetical protein